MLAGLLSTVLSLAGLARIHHRLVAWQGLVTLTTPYFSPGLARIGVPATPSDTAQIVLAGLASVALLFPITPSPHLCVYGVLLTWVLLRIGGSVDRRERLHRLQIKAVQEIIDEVTRPAGLVATRSPTPSVAGTLCLGQGYVEESIVSAESTAANYADGSLTGRVFANSTVAPFLFLDANGHIRTTEDYATQTRDVIWLKSLEGTSDILIEVAPHSGAPPVCVRFLVRVLTTEDIHAIRLGEITPDELMFPTLVHTLEELIRQSAPSDSP